MTHTAENYDPQEVAKFDALASRWWDPQGEMKPLHEINPLRVQYIDGIVALAGKRVLDVGCGGGLLTEAMAQRGAQVTGIDVAAASLQTAKLHLHESGLRIDYHNVTVEQFAEQHPQSFDAVTCMEMLEHVPNPVSIVRACAQLVKPGGAVILSTLNRNPKSYLFAIIGAEYALRMLPKGTHDYRKFIRPSELERWSRAAGLKLVGLRGMTYNPLTRTYSLADDIDVNYFAHCVRESGS
jgi:2-polyprenyl-6-hydroxyphenyl methylase/3-demethylubiquinone-9 3-methyltransferase